MPFGPIVMDRSGIQIHFRFDASSIQSETSLFYSSNTNMNQYFRIYLNIIEKKFISLKIKKKKIGEGSYIMEEARQAWSIAYCLNSS